MLLNAIKCTMGAIRVSLCAFLQKQIFFSLEYFHFVYQKK